MRTTLNLDEDVLGLARSLAEGRKISLGEAVSYLARRGATIRVPLKIRNGFHVFSLDQNAPLFGSEDVRAALEAEDQSRASDFWNSAG